MSFGVKVAQYAPKVLSRFLSKVAKVLLKFSQVSLGGRSAGFLTKVAHVLPRFSQVVLPLLVAGLLDSWLRLPRFSQGSPKWFSFSWWQVCWLLG